MNCKIVLLLAAALQLSGCGKTGIEGIYQCDGILGATLEFKRNGEGYVKRQGAESAFEYKIDGERVISTTGSERGVLTIRGNKLIGDKHLVGTCTLS